MKLEQGAPAADQTCPQGGGPGAQPVSSPALSRAHRPGRPAPASSRGRDRAEEPAREAGRTHREEDHLYRKVEGLGPPVVAEPFSHPRDPDGAATPPISAGSRSLRALPAAPPRAAGEPTSCGRRPCGAANSTHRPWAAATEGPRPGESSEMGGRRTRCSLWEQTGPVCTHPRSEHGTRIAGPGPIAALWAPLAKK